MVIPSSGLQYDCYALPIQGAKAFIARYSNKTGDGYLKFLFDCEEAMSTKVPLLIERIKHLEGWKTKRRGINKVLVRSGAVSKKGLFGEIVEVEKETKPYDELNSEERRSYRFEHRSRIAEGLNKANNKDLDSGKVIPIGTAKDLPRLNK